DHRRLQRRRRRSDPLRRHPSVSRDAGLRREGARLLSPVPLAKRALAASLRKSRRSTEAAPVTLRASGFFWVAGATRGARRKAFSTTTRRHHTGYLPEIWG